MPITLREALANMHFSHFGKVSQNLPAWGTLSFKALINYHQHAKKPFFACLKVVCHNFIKHRLHISLLITIGFCIFSVRVSASASFIHLLIPMVSRCR